MTKSDLIDKVAAQTGLTKKDSGKAVDAVFASIADALKAGDKVQLVGFGTFEVKKRAARTGRNPQTGAELQIPARKVPVFKAGKGLKDLVG
jgi:DNA-binding protein HU-beta